MGMYDTIHFPCPRCKKLHSDQVKGGPENMLDLSLNEQPKLTAKLEGDAYNCDCGCSFTIVRVED